MSAAARAASWLSIAGVGIAMLVLSWGSWPNFQVDFGRELYVPWRLLEGEVLYRDIPWFDGPLSAYWNALVFRVLGVGLLPLVAVNLALTIVLVLLSHALITRTNGPLAATTASLVFVSVFAFSRIDTIGNDNYLTPYSHGVTHGLLFSLLALQLFAMRSRGRLVAAAGSGLALGFVALTKAELFLAAGLALSIAWALDAWVRRGAARESAVGVASLFVAAAALPPLGAFLLLCTAMPMSDAVAGTLGTWSSLAGSSVASQHFYRQILGTLQPMENLRTLALTSLSWAGVLGLPAALALFSARGPHEKATDGDAERELADRFGVLFAAGAAIAAFLATLSLGDFLHLQWPNVLRPLPLALLTLVGLGAAPLALRPSATEASQPGDREVTWLALLVFATVLLAKIGLRVRLDQYGFALAMPGTLFVIAAFVERLPAWIGARGGDERVTRAAILGIVAACVIAFLPIIATRFAERTKPIGGGRDAFLTEPARAPARDALAAIKALPVGATLAVLPEGIMFNYLARRVNPTGIVNFMPPELIVFGEDRIVERFTASPPDYIALTHKDTQEYGVDFFGRGYGQALHAWVSDNYREIASFGDPPLEEGSTFGVKILVRRELGAQ